MTEKIFKESVWGCLHDFEFYGVKDTVLIKSNGVYFKTRENDHSQIRKFKDLAEAETFFKKNYDMKIVIVKEPIIDEYLEEYGEEEL